MHWIITLYRQRSFVTLSVFLHPCFRSARSWIRWSKRWRRKAAACLTEVRLRTEPLSKFSLLEEMNCPRFGSHCWWVDDDDAYLNNTTAYRLCAPPSAPVVKIKQSLTKLKQEIVQIDVRIGVVQHTLLQAKLKEKSNMTRDMHATNIPEPAAGPFT